MSTEEKWRTLNPHTQQAEHPITNIPFTRILAHDAQRKVYRRRTDESKSTVHWGQRKLLMSEIEFLLLTLTNKKKCVVIYAGAAPGTHVRILADMFPYHTFILVDPAPFTVRPEKGRIIIRQEMFTDDLAHKLLAQHSTKSTRLLFISDVRSCDPDFHPEHIHNERINADMNAQAGWHGILRPFKSMLKFRLPYTPGKTEYLRGDVHLPVWGPPSTTECRLVVHAHSPGTIIYDHTEQEEKMFFFNTVTRSALYNHPVVSCGCGIDHCYDCTAEVAILGEYLNKIHPGDACEKTVAWLSELISSKISAERTLAHKNPDREQKIKIIRKNQWPDGIPSYDKFIQH
jgi:cap2 methyltransferase